MRSLVCEASPGYHQERVERGQSAGGREGRESDERWQGVRSRDESMESKKGREGMREGRNKGERMCRAGLRERGKDRCTDC